MGKGEISRYGNQRHGRKGGKDGSEKEWEVSGWNGMVQDVRVGIICQEFLEQAIRKDGNRLSGRMGTGCQEEWEQAVRKVGIRLSGRWEQAVRKNRNRLSGRMGTGCQEGGNRLSGRK